MCVDHFKVIMFLTLAILVKYLLRENNQVLTLSNVQWSSDTGVYQCMSKNSEGVLLKEAILNIGKVLKYFYIYIFLYVFIYIVQEKAHRQCQ